MNIRTIVSTSRSAVRAKRGTPRKGGRRLPSAAGRPALYVAVAAAGALVFNVVTTGDPSAKAAAEPHSVSVAQQLGLTARSSQLDSGDLTPLEQMAASLAASNKSGTIGTTAATGPRSFGFAVGAAETNGVPLSLHYEDAGRSGLRQLKTEVGARFGEYLVLAQGPGVCSAPFGDTTRPASADTCADKPVLRLLIVRVDRIDPHA